MRSNRSVAIASACALALVAGLAASAATPWSGDDVWSSEAQVIGHRVIPVEGSSAVVMTWSEVGADGSTEPYFGISLDGRTIAAVRKADYTVHLNYARFDPKQFTPAVAPQVQAPAGHGAYVVQFETQFIEPYRAALEARGARLDQFLANHSFIVRMDEQAKAQVEALPFVRWVGDFHPAYKLEESLLAEVTGMAGDRPAAPVRRYSVMMLARGDADQGAVAARIQALGGQVAGTEPEGFRLEAFLTTGMVAQVAQMSEVQYIGAKGAPEEDLDIVRLASGAETVHTLGFTGVGVRAEVCDGGLRTTHVDWKHAPVIHTANSFDISHGTSVFGHVFGDGTANPLFKGMIPDAQGIFASYSAVGLLGGTATRYGHTEELVDPAGPYRAVFQTNSWGDGRVTDYTDISSQIDDIQFLNDFNILQSQSNSGSTPSRPQAWGKNTISVGALNHFNTLSKTDDRHGGFTGSTGPAADGRIKPDLMFFYDQTMGPSSGSDTSYSPFSGTSGATPCVAGALGIMYQMWNEGIFGNPVDPTADVFDNRPHAATAKAMMINTAVPYGIDSDKWRVRQGWGIPNVQELYDNRDQFFIVDESDVLTPLQTATYDLTVPAGREDLRVTMVFLEPKGPAVGAIDRINDVNLKVTSPSGVEYWGNNGLMDSIWSAPGGSANDRDNVENVFVQNPEAGVWTVEVTAAEINEDQHVETPALDIDFALVVQGVESNSCYADCDASGGLDFFDFLCFQDLFAAGDPAADCDGSGQLDFFDFLCFQNEFAAGCP